MRIVSKSTSIFSISMGLLLLSINIFGLFNEIRPNTFPADDLRFQFDMPKSYVETLSNTTKQASENSESYSNRLTNVISEGLAHIKWTKNDSSQYHQLIPAWENYILYFMGLFSGIPEYERYHYADYKRSIERGIGICGDASMIMSQILDKNRIQNQIISYPGHVVVEAVTESNKPYLYDADFGVVILHSANEVQRNPDLIKNPYSSKGYSNGEIESLKRMYSMPLARWDGVAHFITKKYYFEYISYFLKWLIPLGLLLIPLLYFNKQRINK